MNAIVLYMEDKEREAMLTAQCHGLATSSTQVLVKQACIETATAIHLPVLHWNAISMSRGT